MDIKARSKQKDWAKKKKSSFQQEIPFEEINYQKNKKKTEKIIGI